MKNLFSLVLSIFLGIAIGFLATKKVSTYQLYRSKLQGLRIGRKEKARKLS